MRTAWRIAHLLRRGQAKGLPGLGVRHGLQLSNPTLQQRRLCTRAAACLSDHTHAPRSRVRVTCEQQADASRPHLWAFILSNDSAAANCTTQPALHRPAPLPAAALPWATLLSSPAFRMASFRPIPAASMSTITRTSGISVRHSGSSSSCRGPLRRRVGKRQACERRWHVSCAACCLPAAWPCRSCHVRPRWSSRLPAAGRAAAAKPCGPERPGARRRPAAGHAAPPRSACHVWLPPTPPVRP